MDVVSKEVRSRMMSGIRGRDTKPELIVRRYLHKKGLRFRLHVRDLPGRPDLVLAKYRTVVFVHGCFWHRHRDCPFAYTPKTNSQFWIEKLTGNVARDAKHLDQLLKLGWNVITIWECSVNQPGMLEKVSEEIKGGLGGTRR